VIREPAVAGTFYPTGKKQLSDAVRHYLEQGEHSTTRPKAMIVPHAGYIYSGPIAGSAYRALYPLQTTIKRVILLGPSHHVAFHGLAAPQATRFKTPLGEVPVDQEALQQVIQLPQLGQHDEPHRQEHSLEVQLPFLQELLGTFSLLPLVVGQSDAKSIAEVLDQLWGGTETLIVVSSDLSHYLPYEEAVQMDRATSNAIVQLDSAAIPQQSACGQLPILGLLQLARERGVEAELIDLRNSGDTAGDKQRVVGYGAYLFAEQAA
jgi:MEMO1 family protein